MTSEAGEPASAHTSPVTWPRRALVGALLLVFALTAFGLVVRWDNLMVRLAEPPVSAPAPEAMR